MNDITTNPGFEYDPEVLRGELIRDEGWRNRLYRDTEGIFTIGVGWNIEAHGLPDYIIEQLLQDSIKEAVRAVSFLYPEWQDKLNGARQRVLINMALNLGQTKFGLFKKMWTAIKQGDWAEASIQMGDSKWARQVGIRAERLQLMMRLGVA